MALENHIKAAYNSFWPGVLTGAGSVMVDYALGGNTGISEVATWFVGPLPAVTFGMIYSSREEFGRYKAFNLQPDSHEFASAGFSAAAAHYLSFWGANVFLMY